jgi:BirA family transcriptional regulator, biotin operon repressor / biotin---[acetyl-CoA-carboxylase] ligase
MPSAPVIDELNALLRTRALGRTAEHHATIDSTNRRALAWAEAGAPHGALVIADHQSAGRGRRGRTWTDQPGLNLLFSVVLRTGMPVEQLPLLALAAGVAVAEGIATFTEPLAPALKWPNDVLLDGRKTCGILPESRLGRAEAVVALGVGINVNQAHFPPELGDTATSLRLATGRTLPRRELLACVLEHLERWIERLEAGDVEAVRDAFTARMVGIGEPAVVNLQNGRPVAGTIRGISPTGALLLETPSRVQEYMAGDVSLRTAQIIHSGTE